KVLNSRRGLSYCTVRWQSCPAMDRDFATAVTNFALWRDLKRVAETIADVANQLQAKGYSAEEIAAAIAELLDELEGSGGRSRFFRALAVNRQLGMTTNQIRPLRCELVPGSRHL
ncbi:MAG: hypothetical protein ACJ8DN_02735, partial [Microvirga sp.]